MSDGVKVCIWTLWECNAGPMKDHVAVLRDDESNIKQAAELAKAVGIAVERMNWERAYTSDRSVWEACESFDTESEAVWDALRGGMTVLRDGAPVPGAADTAAE